MCEDREIHVSSRERNEDIRDLLLQWKDENGPDSKVSIPDDLRRWGSTKLSELTRWRLMDECRKKGIRKESCDEELVQKLLDYKEKLKGSCQKAAKAAKVGSFRIMCLSPIQVMNG
jgi:hypothetical protein